MTIMRDPQTIDPESTEDRVNRTRLAVGRKFDPPRSASTLTADDAARLKEVTPVDPVPLPAGKLACAACGIAADPPKLRAAVIKVPVFAQRAGGGVHLDDVPLTRCPECEGRRQLALRIAAAHPAASAQLGNIVVDVIEQTLIKLAVLGKPLPEPDLTDQELGSLIRAMGSFGGTTTWRSTAAERPGLCSPRPFGWLKRRDRARVSREWIDHFAEQLTAAEPPIALPPPAPPSSVKGDALLIPSGCVMCGVDHVDVPAIRVHRLGGPERASRSVWTAVQVPSGTVGGPADIERLSGHLCPACATARSSAGAVGQTAIELAVERHLKAIGRPDLADHERIVGYVTPAWAALVARAHQHGQPVPRPNRRPWEHVQFEEDRT